MQDLLLILDFDKQYSKSTAMRLRAEGVWCKIVSADISAEEIRKQQPLGLILAGATEGEIPPIKDFGIFGLGIPVLALGDCAAGVCHALYGTVGDVQDIRMAEQIRFAESLITSDLSESERMLHRCRTFSLNENAKAIAYMGEEAIGFCDQTSRIFCLGFQIEANDQEGLMLLVNFAKQVCAVSFTWSEALFIANQKAAILEKAGEEGVVVCALTGGLASAVAATIAHKALGERLHCVFIDTGLLRENEADDFIAYYTGRVGLNIQRVRAQTKFIEALSGKYEEEEKARTIRDLMKEELKSALWNVPYTMIIRGVTKPDVWRNSESIIEEKEKITFSPLNELFKEEVRLIAENLGMPPEIYNAQPFPGTGLALRVDGEATAIKIASLRRADAIFTEELNDVGLTKKLRRYFATMHQIGHGKQGIILHAQNMTMGPDGNARLLPARLPHDLLERTAERIFSACPELQNIAYDLSASTV